MIHFFRKFKYPIILIVLFTILIFFSAINYANAVFSDISSSVFRLHVIANSDSKEDQSLKLKVRDSILEYINNIEQDINSKEDFIAFANSHLDELTEVSKKTIEEEGFSYDVSLEIGNFYFPTKSYGNVTFPAGNYDGLNVKIGKAKGQNWWCVMFPPLCFIDNSSCEMDSSSIKILEENLSSENLSIISEDSPDIKFKFKIIEWLNHN